MQDVRRLPIEGNEEVAVTLDELAREGARRMIAAALEVEVEQYVASFVEEVDENGKRLVVARRAPRAGPLHPSRRDAPATSLASPSS